MFMGFAKLSVFNPLVPNTLQSFGIMFTKRRKLKLHLCNQTFVNYYNNENTLHYNLDELFPKT